MSNLNIEKLVKVAIEVLSKQNYNGDLKLEKPSNNKANIWKKITAKYFDNSDIKKDLLNIHSWWRRNTKNFQHLLNEYYFSQLSDNKMGDY